MEMSDLRDLEVIRMEVVAGEVAADGSSGGARRADMLKLTLAKGEFEDYMFVYLKDGIGRPSGALMDVVESLDFGEEVTSSPVGTLAREAHLVFADLFESRSGLGEIERAARSTGIEAAELARMSARRDPAYQAIVSELLEAVITEALAARRHKRERFPSGV